MSEHTQKLSDSDPKALRGFALIAARESDEDTARVLNAAADRIAHLTHLIDVAAFHFFCCGAGVHHEDECGSLVPAMADLAKAIDFHSGTPIDDDIAAVPTANEVSERRRALTTQPKGEGGADG